jgi:hypothetical protein
MALAWMRNDSEPGMRTGRSYPCVALLICAGEDDGIVQGCWLLECNICPQWVTQARDEQLDLLLLGQGGVAIGEHDEELVELIDGVGASQHGQLADGAITEWGPKP